MLVQQSLAGFLSDPARIDSELGSLGLTDTSIVRAVQLVPISGDRRALRETLDLLEASVSIDTHTLKVELNRGLLGEALKVGAAEELLQDPINLVTPVSLKRRGVELRLVYAAMDARPAKHREFAFASGEMSESQFTQFLRDTLGNAASVMRSGAIAFVCMDWRHMGELLSAGGAVFTVLKNLVVWNKSNGGIRSTTHDRHRQYQFRDHVPSLESA